MYAMNFVAVTRIALQTALEVLTVHSRISSFLLLFFCFLNLALPKLK